MITLESAKFFRGPNRYYEGSGLFLEVHSANPAEETIADKSITNAMLDWVMAYLTGDDRGDVWEATQQIVATPICQADMFLSLTARFLHEFSISPAKGELCSCEGQTIALFVPCDHQQLGLVACRLAANICTHLPQIIRNPNQPLRQQFTTAYQQFYRLGRQTSLNQSTMAIARKALERGIPVSKLQEHGQLTQLGQGKRQMRIAETMSDKDTSIGVRVQRDKMLTSRLLANSNLPVAHTRLVHSEEDALRLADQLGYPIVVKPRAGSKGDAVATNIRNPNQLLAAIQKAGQSGSGVVMERFITGADHRLLVIGGRCVAIAKRLPAHIIGDGHSSVEMLIQQTNRDPRRGVGFDKLLEKITIDDEAIMYLKQSGMSLESVPPKGREIILRGSANLSRGGTAIDVTDQAHPDNLRMAERAARLIGVDIAGVDFIAPDICRSWREQPCAIIEVNASPGLRPHQSANAQRDVITPIVDHLFPRETDGRIPTVGVTGSLGKTSTCRFIAAILENEGQMVARSSTNGAWIGDEQIAIGDVAGGRIAAQMLQDPIVEAGVFEFARGGLARNGMVLDQLDIGVFLNVRDIHIGADGINSKEEMADLKSLVVRNARKLVVLNADDPLVLAARKHVKAPTLCLVSTSEGNPAVVAHKKQGGMVAIMSGSEAQETLSLWDQGALIGSIKGAEIADSWNGRFRPALINALYAMSAAYGLGVAFSQIKQTLMRFLSTPQTNLGRTNFIQDHPFNLILAHACNQAAVEELVSFADKIETTGKRYLLLCNVGNRSDAFIRDTARKAAGHFDRYICTNFYQDRGREPHEIPQLLAAGLQSAGVAADQIEIEPDIETAVRLAYGELVEGDLLVDNSMVNRTDTKWFEVCGQIVMQPAVKDHGLSVAQN